MASYDRRAFLRRAGIIGAGAVAGTSVVAARPAAAADDDLAPFVHGVASGDPTASSVVLWTRITLDGAPDPVPVRWQVARDLDFTDVVASGEATAAASDDHTVKFTVAGLEPFTYYYYRFVHGSTPSITGRTKTAPAAGQDVDRLRFGQVSCANYEGGYFNAYARLAERGDMDAIICLGDYIYEYGQGSYGPGEGIGRVVQPPEEMVTLDQYRGRFAHYRLDPDLRRLHQLYPWINTWDDHETTNDSWRDGAENHDPGEGDWEERKRNAWKAYREWLPIDVDATRIDEPIVLYRTLAYGDLADIIVMDTRIDDRDQGVFEILEPGIIETEIDNPDRRMISDDQRRLVQTSLRDSTAAWRVIAQQVMMMQWHIPALPEGLADVDLDFLSVLVTPGGNALNGDAWDGYRAERNRLFSHLRDHDITDVVVLTGDIHTTWAAELTEDPLNLLHYDATGLLGTLPRNLGVEFVTPSITSDNFDEIIQGLGVPAELSDVLVTAIETLSGGPGAIATNPHIKSVDLSGHGYAIVDITAERTTFDTFFVPITEPSDSETFHESWYVERSDGTPGQTAADRGHKLFASASPTPSRTAVAAAPAPLPTPLAAGSQPSPGPSTGPEEPSGGRLPATGGSLPLVAGTAAAAAALALRSRNRPEVGRD